MLRAVVAAEPGNEMAWMWLANVAETPAGAADCLEKVLALNPANELARSTLERCRSAIQSGRSAGPADPVAPSAALADAALRPETGRTVLVVDDDPAVRESIALALKVRGYQTRGAGDGYEVVDQLRKHGRPISICWPPACPAAWTVISCASCCASTWARPRFPSF